MNLGPCAKPDLNRHSTGGISRRKSHLTLKGTQLLQHTKNTPILPANSPCHNHRHKKDRTNRRPYMAPINRDLLFRHENDHSAAQVLVEISRRAYVKTFPLSKLPAEIVLHIMEVADSSSDLMSLILTASIFNDLWRLHIVSISSAVLSRSFGCFDEAKKLEEAVHPRISVGFEAALARHVRMVRAAKFVSDVHELFVKDYLGGLQTLRTPLLHEEECVAFRRSLYRLWLHLVTAHFKPLKFREPVHPFPLMKDEILALCELIVFIKRLTYNRTSETDKLFLIPHRIYRRKDRRRCAQSQRWQICCTEMWHQPSFVHARREHWYRDLGFNVPEPSRSIFYDNSFHLHQPLLKHLRRAREMKLRARLH